MMATQVKNQVENRTDRAGLLRRALQLDAVASGALGVALVTAFGPLGRLLELPNALLLDGGLVMLVWAAVTGWLGTRSQLRRGAAVAVIALNLLWAIDSVGLLATGWVSPNGLGVGFVVAQAVAVLGLAELQYLGLRRMTVS